MIIYYSTTFKFLPAALICLLGWLLSCPLTFSQPLYFFGFRIMPGGFRMLLPDQCSEVPEHLQCWGFIPASLPAGFLQRSHSHALCSSTHLLRATLGVLPARPMELASLKWQLGYMLAQTHEQGALAMQDAEAADRLRPPLREQLYLLQQAAARNWTQRGPHLLNGPVVCGGKQRGSLRDRQAGKNRVSPRQPCSPGTTSSGILAPGGGQDLCSDASS